MEVLQTSEYLVEEDLDVVSRQVLWRDDDLVQVALHELRDDVDLLEEVQVGRLEDVERGQHILMLEETQHAQLPEDPLAGDERLEDVGHLLQGDPSAVTGVRHSPYNTEGAVADGSVWSHLAAVRRGGSCCLSMVGLLLLPAHTASSCLLLRLLLLGVRAAASVVWVVRVYSTHARASLGCTSSRVQVGVITWLSSG